MTAADVVQTMVSRPIMATLRSPDAVGDDELLGVVLDWTTRTKWELVSHALADIEYCLEGVDRLPPSGGKVANDYQPPCKNIP